MKRRAKRRTLRHRHGRALGPQFDAMARDIVGDGKKPNRFFVTADGGVVGVLEHKHAAIAAAKALGEGEPIVVEDRLTGVLWGNKADERRQAVED